MIWRFICSYNHSSFCFPSENLILIDILRLSNTKSMEKINLCYYFWRIYSLIFVQAIN
jgi:hypothetical protein